MTNRFVGQRVLRVEDERLLTGRGTYVDDVEPPGTLHAAFVRSDVARGTIVSIDASDACAATGVRAVFTADDINDDVVEWWHDIRPAVGDRSYPPMRLLARDDVRFVGEPIAIVVADDRYLAEDACELIVVDIEPAQAVIGMAAAAAPGAAAVHPEWGSNVAAERALPPDPDLERLFASATHVITETFVQHRYTCVPMENRGIVATWEPNSALLDIRLATQGPHAARSFISRALGLHEHQIRVVMKDVGGGFGQKMVMLGAELAVVVAARRLGGTVKWIEDRRENLIAGGQSRDAEIELSAAIDGDGRILAIHGHMTEDVGAFPALGTGASATNVAMMLPGPYRVAQSRLTAAAYYTNTDGRCPYRGPWLLETVAREQLVDIIASRLAVDPLELRRRNVVGDDELPYTTATGVVYDELSIVASLEQAAALVDHDRFRDDQAKARTVGRLLGLGYAVSVEPTAMTHGALGSEGATVRINVSGSVDVMVGSASHGQSLETTIVQVVADELGVDMTQVRLVQGDTASTPYGPGVGGSRSAVVHTGAARAASVAVRDRMLAIAAHMLEASPADMESRDGTISVRGTPTSSVSVREVARIAWFGHRDLPSDLGAGLEASIRYAPEAAFTFANSTHACIVEVDPDTGVVQVLRYIVSGDCGVIINPTVVEGQTSGGIAQGIGGVLYEHMRYDADGNPLTTTFLDYLLPTAMEVPDIEHAHIETPASSNPGGHKGMGEGGAIVSPAAVINAVRDALAHLGVTINRQPLDPCTVLEMIDSAGATT